MATLLITFGALALAQVFDDPTITPAPAPSSSNVLLFPGIDASGPCKNIICYDYINTCSIRYGTCYPACGAHARPTFAGAGPCEGGQFRSSFSKSENIATRAVDACGYKCDYRTDSCSNTFGPGCYTSCSGSPAPLFTTPVCETAAPPVRTVLVTPVPAERTIALAVPLDALNRRAPYANVTSVAPFANVTSSAPFANVTSSAPFANLTSSAPFANITISAPFANVTTPASVVDVTSSAPFFEVTSSEPAESYLPDEIPEGGATIGAQLATMQSQVYGYLPVADIMDSPATEANQDPIAVATPAFTDTTTTADYESMSTTAAAISLDSQSLSSASFSSEFVSSSDIASSSSSSLEALPSSEMASTSESAFSTEITSTTESAFSTEITSTTESAVSTEIISTTESASSIDVASSTAATALSSSQTL
ncbi:hypothetical protein SMMN14_06646 [Sphaerulina musiva]